MTTLIRWNPRLRTAKRFAGRVYKGGKNWDSDLLLSLMQNSRRVRIWCRAGNCTNTHRTWNCNKYSHSKSNRKSLWNIQELGCYNHVFFLPVLKTNLQKAEITPWKVNKPYRRRHTEILRLLVEECKNIFELILFLPTKTTKQKKTNKNQTNP